MFLAQRRKPSRQARQGRIHVSLGREPVDNVLITNRALAEGDSFSQAYFHVHESPSSRALVFAGALFHGLAPEVNMNTALRA